MALSLVVSPEPLADRPRVRLDVTGTNVIPNAVGPNSLVNLYRTHEDGRKYPVITEADARLSAGAGIWYDYHAPFDQRVTYTVVIGTVEQSGLEQSGYWNYAPAPNLLPSQVAGLGKSGNPLENGWVVSRGELTRSGDDLKQTDSRLVSAKADIAPVVVPVQLAAGTLCTAQVKVRFGGGGVFNPSASMSWFDSDGNALDGFDIEDGNEWFPGDEPTFVGTGTVPVGAVSYSMSLILGATDASGYALYKKVMVQSGGVASAFPAAEYVPLQLLTTLLTSDETWLISPSLPDLSCAVHAVKSVAPQTQPSQSGLQVIIGRKNPIAITAGRRAGRRGSIVVRSDSAELDSQIETLMSTDGPILINPQGGFERDMPWLWVQPGDLEGPINRAEYTGYEYREYTIPFTEVDQPEVYSNALWSWDDVTATYATWSDVTANYATWSDLQTDTRLT